MKGTSTSQSRMTALAIFTTILSILFGTLYFRGKTPPPPPNPPTQVAVLSDLFAFALDVEYTDLDTGLNPMREIVTLRRLNELRKSTLSTENFLSYSKTHARVDRSYCFCRPRNWDLPANFLEEKMGGARSLEEMVGNEKGCCYCTWTSPASSESTKPRTDPGTPIENIFVLEVDGILKDPSLTFFDSTGTVLGKSEISSMPGLEAELLLISIPIKNVDYIGTAKLNLGATLNGEEIDYTIQGIMNKQRWSGFRQVVNEK